MDSLDHCLLDSVFDFFDDPTDVSLPSSITCPDDDEEEELEWLNGDAFPTLDTFDALACATAPKQQSPVSVLESCGVLRVPGRARSKRRRRRCGGVFFPIAEFAPPATATLAAAAAKRKCLHCEAEKTPQWRAGPLGPKTLCNACGVRYKSGRLVPEYRPANSPTYSSTSHSNSHRKIVEMRRLKYSGQG